MATRMDRAGRKRMVEKVLRMAWRKDDRDKFTVGQVAKKMGLKSSTYLKDLLFELVTEIEEIYHVKEHGIDKWYFKPYAQQIWESRHITINGERKKIAAWVADYIVAQP